MNIRRAELRMLLLQGNLGPGEGLLHEAQELLLQSNLVLGVSVLVADQHLGVLRTQLFNRPHKILCRVIKFWQEYKAWRVY